MQSIANASSLRGGGTVPTAAQVSYDNTESGLTATNVQDAIDEIAQGGDQVTQRSLTLLPHRPFLLLGALSM